ncbi:MAG: MinD/ParA family protein [Burkholderiaceae bacterium]|nr:MinD/ParA family protein [Burkholderiaceae bacterium]
MVEDTKLDETVQAAEQPAQESTTDREEAAAIRTDQAEGLRSMFGEKTARFVCLGFALDADTAATIAVGTAHALRAQNQRVLLIDEIPLQDRRTLHGLAYPVRYDVSQALENNIPVEQAIHHVDDNLWFAAGLRMTRAYQSRKLRTPNLMQRIAKTQFEFDIVLLATTNPIQGVLRAYAHDRLQLVISAPDEPSQITALEQIRTLSARTEGAKIPVLIVGGHSEEEGRQAFERLQTAAESLLEQPLESMGWIAAVTIPNSTTRMKQPSGLILPATLYAKLAGTTLQLGE